MKYLMACLWIAVCARSFAQVNSVENSVVYSTDGAMAVSDTAQLFTVRDIAISGNEKTKSEIILRELPFGTDRQYPLGTIVQNFKKAKKQLMNTGLFRDVVISLERANGQDLYINIAVEEKWYVWPMVFFKPVDKSFGKWWSEKDRSLDRINYGLRLSHNNISGRNDKLRLSVMNGYTRQVAFQYYGLWLDDELKWSTNAGISYAQNREVNYMTYENKQVAVKGNNNFLHSAVGGFIQLNYRPAIKTVHTFGAGYNYESIADTVFKLNPSFASGSKFLSYPELFYRLAYTDVDYISYPTRGFLGDISLKRKGFGSKSSVNLWEVSAKASQTWPVGEKYFFNLKGLGMIKLPFKQPYTGKQFIGYEGRYMQGYEYYVIDGIAGGYAKATLARPVFSTHFHIPSQRLKPLSNIPVKVYAKTFINSGYVYNTKAGDNKLTNNFLYSGGVGLDIVTYSDFVIKIEWSFNRLGENGLYLHQRSDF
jgi:outer membrane protein assembly factor BamA